MGEWVDVRTCFGIVYSNYQVKQVPHESGSSWPEEQVLTSSDLIAKKDVTKITTYWPHLIILLNTSWCLKEYFIFTHLKPKDPQGGLHIALVHLRHVKKNFFQVCAHCLNH